MTYSLNDVFEIVSAFSAEKNVFKLLDIILTKMMEMTNSDAGTLYTLEHGQLLFRIVRNLTLNTYQQSESGSVLPPVILDESNIENISAYAAINNEIVLVDDVYEDSRFNFSGPRNYDKLTGYRTQSMLVMPLSSTFNDEESVIGVIQLLNARSSDNIVIPFGRIVEPPILHALANIAANTLANLTYAREINDLFNSFVAVMTQAIDERSPYNNNHTKNVALYCQKFAQYLNTIYPDSHELHFSNARTERLRMAALLHDIGKIITPLEVMDKPDRLGRHLEFLRYRFEIKALQLDNELLSGKLSSEQHLIAIRELKSALELIETSNTAGYLPDDKIAMLTELRHLSYRNSSGDIVPLLTDAELEAITIQKGTLTDSEREIMQEHVSLTERLLDRMIFNNYYSNVPSWASSHHEFLDGSGYPKALSNDDITIETRILTIMDIFDALTASDRPYKKAMSAERALDVLKSMVDEGKLDGALVTLFAESGIGVNDEK